MILVGALLVGMAFCSLYFVFDGRQTLMDIFNLFLFGLAFSYGIVGIVMGIRQADGIEG